MAYAYKVLEQKPEIKEADDLEKDMLFAGLVGMVDPARIEVKKAIVECKAAGIKIVMITGDHPATAEYIAREIGIMDETGLLLTGAELAKLSDDAFLAQVERTLVYARVSPAQKLRIIRALQSKEHFVAMTGDGVNDAPSLKAANIIWVGARMAAVTLATQAWHCTGKPPIGKRWFYGFVTLPIGTCFGDQK